MRDTPKLLLHVILGAGVLLVAAVITVSLLAPMIVERAIAKELRARGFSDARFEVGHVGLRRAVIEDVRLDAAGRLAVQSLSASYSPLGLINGEIELLQIVGARWVVRMHQGALDLGPVDQLLESGGDEQERAELPVRRIELLASEVIVAEPTQEWHVPIEGVLERAPDGFRVHMSAAAPSLPIELFADVRQRPRLEADVSLTATGSRHETLRIEGQLASDGRVHVQLHGRDWSTDSVLAGRRVAIAGLSVVGSGTLARQPLELDALELELTAGAIRIDDQHLERLHVNASRAEETIALDVDWAAPSANGVVTIRGLPTRLSPESLSDASLSWRASVAMDDATTPTIIATSDETRLVQRDDQWSLQVDDGRIESQSLVVGEAPVRLEGLQADFGFAVVLPIGGAEDEGRGLETTVDLTGSAAKVGAANVRGTLDRLRVHVSAHRAEGGWEVRGRADVRFASVMHATSGLRIEQVSAVLPLHYPFSEATTGDTGTLRVGPMHWRETTLPVLSGELAQQGDELSVSLQWPLTPEVAVRGRGRIGLTAPFAGDLQVMAPPFALEDAPPIVAIVERALGGTITGKAAMAGQFGIRKGVVTQALRMRVGDVTVSRSSKSPQEIHGLAGTIELDSVVPPTSPGGQRLRWKGARVGKLTLGEGHLDFALEKDRSLIVEEVATDLDEDSGGGRLFVGAFRYAPDQPEVRLDLFAEALSLQHWLELLGRDEVVGSGTLHGHVSARVQLEPSLRLRLGDGMLLAEPGGTLALKDVRAAEAALASGGTTFDASAIQQIVKQRLLEALQNLRYSSLRFELVHRDGGVTLQVHLAGRGTRGARQEIGGLTININQFEDALNQMLRLRSGVKKLESKLPGEVVSHASPIPQP